MVKVTRRAENAELHLQLVVVWFQLTAWLYAKLNCIGFAVDSFFLACAVQESELVPSVWVKLLKGPPTLPWINVSVKCGLDVHKT